MKKFITQALFLSALMLSSSGYAMASPCSYVCSENIELTSATSRFFSNITGQNFIGEKVGESLIKKALKKNADGDFKVTLNSYSVRDLKAGKFKSLDIKGKNILVDGIYISEAEMSTLCEYNYISQDKNGDYLVMEDIPIAISAVITEDDLNKTMMSKDYQRLLNDLNTLGGAFNIFSIDSTKIKIKDNKIYYIVKIAVPFVRATQEVVMSANLKVVDGEIKFSDPELLNNRHEGKDLSKLASILNYINPLDFSMKILENKDADLSIRNISIQDGKILVDAKMLILKDVNK